MGRRGLADTGLDSGSASMRRGLDTGILAKGAMRHFWKIANRAIIAFAGKIFVKIPGKIFGEIVLGKIWWSGLSLELKFSLMEFRRRLCDGKPRARLYPHAKKIVLALRTIS